MPAYAVDAARGAYGDLDGTRVLVLGAAYRGGVKETAFSGVFPLRDALQGRGAQVDGCTTRCTPTRSSASSASSPRTASRSTAPWSRPTTPSTETLEIPADGIVDGRGIVRDAGGVPLKRIGS